MGFQPDLRVGVSAVVEGTSSLNGFGPYLQASSLNDSSAVWPTANTAIYIPITFQTPATVYQLAVINGSTASGNWDVGLFDEAGTQLVSSGSTAQAGTSAVQLFDIANTSVGAGRYWLGAVLDNITGTARRFFSSGTALISGVKQEASAFPLPSTATLTTAGTGYIPCIYAIGTSGTI